jgi:hypothetical protein
MGRKIQNHQEGKFQNHYFEYPCYNDYLINLFGYSLVNDGIRV